MNVGEIKQYIISNPTTIATLLEKSGFYNVTFNDDEYRAAIDETSNPTSVRVTAKTLASSCFSRNIKGDIISLIQWKMNLGFVETIKHIKQVLDLGDSNYTYKPPKAIFGGFFKGFTVDDSKPLEVIDESLLDPYTPISNMQFLKDGISLSTQSYFGLRYDFENHRIIIPYHNTEGQLVGAIGRANYDNPFSKYLAVIPFPKGQTLYGYSQNYNEIQQSNLAIVGESEKFVMQLYSMGLGVGIGLGGDFISKKQVEALQSLGIDTIIVALDEDRTEYHIKEETKKLVFKNPLIKCNIGYIYDRDKKYLKIGSKNSPTDLGKDTFLKLMKEYIVWL